MGFSNTYFHHIIEHIISCLNQSFYASLSNFPQYDNLVIQKNYVDKR